MSCINLPDCAQDLQVKGKALHATGNHISDSAGAISLSDTELIPNLKITVVYGTQMHNIYPRQLVM